MYLFFFLLFSIFVQSRAKNVATYKESQIFKYIKKVSENEDVSAICAKSLARVIPMLNSNITLSEQRRFFQDSFASGLSYQFTSRDLDRWFYKSMECLKVAGETAYSSSEYPTDYCFGMNGNKVFGICIPTNCENDRQIVSFMQYFKNV